MNDNQNIKSDLLATIVNEERHAPTITRFVEDHFSDLVPDSDYFTHLVRDDVGGEMLPPLPAEVISRLPRYYTAVTDLYDAPFLKTSQATALFALTSAMMPNSYVRHGKRLVSPAVMVIHYGTSGAGKGNISDLRTLFEAVDRRRIEESERALQQYDYDMEAYKQNLKCHFADRKEVQPTGRRAPEGLQRPKKPLRRSLEIPADTSSADFVLRLKGNEPYPSLLMSEELLTTISANRTKHGDFVHYILNCYHEEPIHRGRKTDDEDTIVHRPRLAMLLSGYFSTKNFAGRMTKDDRLELTEMALVSLEELDSLTSAELNQLKAITTDPTVNERAAFARYKERRPHIASFCGTGNNPRFLTDLTDNRRWLPFLVRDIDSPWSHPLPYTEMYAQAYTLYRTGFRYWFDTEENAELQRHNRQFEEPCMEEELIATYLRVPYGDEVGEFLTATRIIELIGGAVKRPLSAKKVALCMNRLGFEARRIRNVRGWNVVILTGNDIKEDQRLNAHRSVED